MKKRKIKFFLMVSVMGVSIFALNNVSIAADDNIGFKFTIKSVQENAYSGSRYRQTNDTNNKWKVQLKSSGEGKGTITRFWLAKKTTWDGNVVASDLKNVKQGAGATYSTAYKKANKSDVVLGAENNNVSYNTYSVSGVWDEETW